MTIPAQRRAVGAIETDRTREGDGALAGAVNLLTDLRDREWNDEDAQRLAAIVSSSDDGIISIDLNGVIRSWNAGAERIFGYAADEIVGKPVTLLISQDRHDEEPSTLGPHSSW